MEVFHKLHGIARSSRAHNARKTESMASTGHSRLAAVSPMGSNQNSETAETYLSITNQRRLADQLTSFPLSCTFVYP